MRIYKNKGNIAIEFAYNQAFVDIVKNLPGRKYSAEQKCWTVPEHFAREAVEALKPLGFQVEESLLKSLKQKEDFELKTKLPLFEYQKEGVKFLLKNKRAFLGFDTGLGKSLVAITACEELGLERVLVITMASLKWTFAGEILKWYPDKKIVVVNGSKAERQKQYKEPADFYVVNYETVRVDLAEPFFQQTFSMIIADESSKIKNPQAKISKALKLLKAERRIAMSATIISNTPADLWSQMTFLLPGILGSWWSFRQKYCKLDYWGSVVGYHNLDDLQKRIAPYFLRRTKDEVMKELPEKTYVDIPVEFSASEKRLYKAIKNEILSEIDMSAISKVDAGTLNSILTKLVRLQQVANSSELVGDSTESSKLAALKDLLAILEGQKVIVFTRFKQMANILARELGEHNPLLVTGDTPTEARLGLIKEFEDKDKQILIATETLSYGQNMEFCSYMIHYDLPWSVGKLDQRHGRIDRIGATKPITYYSLLVRGTVDEFVRKTLHNKNCTAEEIFEGIKKLLS